MTVGQRVFELLKQKGMTQKELTTLVSDTLTKILQLLKGIEKHCHI